MPRHVSSWTPAACEAADDLAELEEDVGALDRGGGGGPERLVRVAERFGSYLLLASELASALMAPPVGVLFGSTSLRGFWVAFSRRSLGARAIVRECLLFCDKPRCSASWPVWTRRTVLQQWFVYDWYCRFCDVLHFVVHRLKMLGILVGMDQKDSLQRHSGRAFRRLRQCMCKDGLLFFLRPVMCSIPWLAGPDDRHHGRYGTEGLFRGDAAQNCGFSAVAAHHQGHLHPCLGAEGFSHGPGCLADHRDSPVARGHGGRCPHYACRVGSSRHLPCRGAKADPHDQAVQQTLPGVCVPVVWVKLVLRCRL